MLFEVILAFWGCMSELDQSCTREVFDMTNAASTWVGLILGLVLGGVITWWVYYRQKKISRQQDELLDKVKELAEKEETAANARTNPTDVQDQTADPAQLQAEKEMMLRQLSTMIPKPPQLNAAEKQRQLEAAGVSPAARSESK